MATRVRPARRPRWRRYVPGALFVLLSPLVALPPSTVARYLGAVGLEATGMRVVLGAAGVGLAMLAAGLANRSPARVLVLGGLAVSVGGNLLQGPWIGLPLAVAGLGWILVLEVRRLFEGVTLSPVGLTLHRVLQDPLVVDFEDVRAVHTSMHGQGAGTLILETEHGTVTAPHLPDPETLQARLEARLRPEPVEPTRESLERSRRRLEEHLGAAGS
jgi:hypothetical protein